jgi:AcrR family transcriptional regulator
MAVKNKREIQPKKTRSMPAPSVKKRLEAAVLEVFSKEDFHKADMRTIAKEAGVSFETIYKHYGSKEKLLFAFIDEWLGELTEQTLKNMEGVSGIKEKLGVAVWTQLNYYEQNPEMARILYLTVPQQTWMADDSYRQPRLAGVLIEAIREGRRSGALKASIRASHVLDLIYGVVRRSFTIWIYRGQTESLASQSDAIFELIWGGISKSDA